MSALSESAGADSATVAGGADPQRRRFPSQPNRRSTAPAAAAAPPLLLSALPHSPALRRPPPPAEVSAVTVAPSPVLFSSPPSSSGRIPRPSSRVGCPGRASLSPPATSAPLFCSSPAPGLTLDELSMEPLSLIPTLTTDCASALPPSSPVQPLRTLHSSPQRRQKSSRTLSEYALAAVMAQATDADSLLGISRGVVPVVIAEGGASGVATPKGDSSVGLRSNKQRLAPLTASRRTLTLTSAPQLRELTERAERSRGWQLSPQLLWMYRSQCKVTYA